LIRGRTYHDNNLQEKGLFMKKEKEASVWSGIIIWIGVGALLAIGLCMFHNHELMTWYIKVALYAAFMYCMMKVGGHAYKIVYSWRIRYPKHWEERIMMRISKKIKKATEQIVLARHYQEENYKKTDAYKKRFDPFNMDLNKIMEKGKQDGNVL